MRTKLLVLLVLLAAAAAGCTTDQPASAGTNAPDAPVEGSVPIDDEQVTVDQALAVASAYFAAYNDGDADAITALLAQGAEFSDGFSGSIARDAWEQRLAWNLAQATRLSTPDCFATVNADIGRATEVACESATLNAQIQAVGARPVPTLVRISVSPRGVEEIREEYGEPDFLAATAPFREWLEVKHPDIVDEVGFGAWNSAADAERNGRLTREYSRQWAGWLEANCVRIPGLISPDRDSYLDDC